MGAAERSLGSALQLDVVPNFDRTEESRECRKPQFHFQVFVLFFVLFVLVVRGLKVHRLVDFLRRVTLL